MWLKHKGQWLPSHVTGATAADVSFASVYGEVRKREGERGGEGGREGEREKERERGGGRGRERERGGGGRGRNRGV